MIDEQRMAKRGEGPICCREEFPGRILLIGSMAALASRPRFCRSESRILLLLGVPKHDG